MTKSDLARMLELWQADLRKSPATKRVYRRACERVLVYVPDTISSDLGGILVSACMKLVPEETKSPEGARAMRTALCYIAGVKGFVGWLEGEGKADISSSRFAYRLSRMLPTFTPAMPQPNCEAVQNLVQTIKSKPAHKVIDKRNRAIILTLASSGIRRAELCALRWHDVDMEGLTLRIFQGKGGKTRQALITREAAHALRQWKEVEPKRGQGDSVFGISSGQVWRVISRLAQGISPHDFRHALATNLVKNGAGLAATKELLGHANVQTTMRYVHLGQGDLRAAYEKGMK